MPQVIYIVCVFLYCVGLCLGIARVIRNAWGKDPGRAGARFCPIGSIVLLVGVVSILLAGFAFLGFFWGGMNLAVVLASVALMHISRCLTMAIYVRKAGRQEALGRE